MSEHTHTWEATDLGYATYGRKWQQIKAVSYCPACGGFGSKTSIYLDGDFFKTQREADAANDDMDERHRTERAAWLREHYPERTTEEVAR